MTLSHCQRPDIQAYWRDRASRYRDRAMEAREARDYARAFELTRLARHFAMCSILPRADLLVLTARYDTVTP